AAADGEPAVERHVAHQPLPHRGREPERPDQQGEQRDEDIERLHVIDIGLRRALVSPACGMAVRKMPGRGGRAFAACGIAYLRAPPAPAGAGAAPGVFAPVVAVPEGCTW